MLHAASIGMGWWSDELADAIQGKSEAIRIVTCFTRSESKRSAFSEKYGTSTHKSYNAVLADDSIDAVLLTTPHSLHAEQIIAAARAGKHVFVEKPFTLTRASAQKAVDACSDAEVILAVGHNRRYHSAIQTLKTMIENEEFGTILHAEANFSVASALSYPSTLWRANRLESPAGAITALGIHMIDALTYLLGPVERVCTQAYQRAVTVDIDDTTTALFTFKSGVSAYLGTLFACPHTSFLNIYGTHCNSFAEVDGSRLRVQTENGELRDKPLEPQDTLRLELEDFAAAISGSSQFIVRPTEAVHDVAIMEAMVSSSRLDKWITVEV